VLKTFLRKIFGYMHLRLLPQKGQITQDTQIGRWIFLLSSLEDVMSIVEIGTWNGKGSSLQIARGVVQRNVRPSRVVGLESDLILARKATQNLRKYDFFEVVHGRIIEDSDLDGEGLEGDEKEWFLQDQLNLSSCPNFFKNLPTAIDLLILDGGEFSTYAEFIKLQERVTNWIVLDDTNSRKCRRVLREIYESNSFAVVYKSQERNGIAIIKRVK
jgi:hypothetical protein